MEQNQSQMKKMDLQYFKDLELANELLKKDIQLTETFTVSQVANYSEQAYF